jgi:hypothetical protein
LLRRTIACPAGCWLALPSSPAGRDDPCRVDLPDAVVTLPGTMPSNVEQGFGFVGGVGTRTIPFHRCGVLAASADRESPCTIRYNSQSASISGRVIREPCGTPYELADIRLTERFAGGGTIRLEVDFIVSQMADMAELVPGSVRAGGRTVSYTADSYKETFRAWRAMYNLAGVQ